MPISDSSKTPSSRLGLHNEAGELSINKQSVLGAVGGWLGIVESILPAMVFVIILASTKNTVLSVISAASVSAIFLVLQIIRKKPLTQSQRFCRFAMVGMLPIIFFRASLPMPFI
jgi:hypothetical protein